MDIKAVKKAIFEVITPSDFHSTKASKIFDMFIISLIIVNVALVVIDTFDVMKLKIFDIIEIISVIIFTIEYLLRVWTADLLFPDRKPFIARLKYIFSFMALIDLIAILPFYVPFLLKDNLMVLRSLRAVRLLRLFKITRYTSVLSTLGIVFKKKAGQVISSMFVVLILMVITSVLMYQVEHAAQPDKFSNAFDSLWWTVATVTTVGYGDLYPITVVGQILSTIIAFLGIGLIAIPTGIISAGFIEHVNLLKEEENEKKQGEKCFCPYCGKKIT